MKLVAYITDAPPAEDDSDKKKAGKEKGGKGKSGKEDKGEKNSLYICDRSSSHSFPYHQQVYCPKLTTTFI